MNTTATRNIIAALFNDRPSADRAYQAALDRGYTHDRITTVMTEEAARNATRRARSARPRRETRPRKVQESVARSVRSPVG